MKNRILAALLCVSMTGLMLMGCADTRDDGTIKIGITIQNLSNAYWAGVMMREDGSTPLSAVTTTRELRWGRSRTSSYQDAI